MGNDFQSTLQLSTTQLNFTTSNASLWGPGGGTSYSTTFNGLVCTAPGTGIPIAGVLGNSQLGLDYALNVSPITYGFPIDLGLSAGVFSLNYPVSASIAMPTTVMAGDIFTVATAGGIASNPTMAINGPSANVTLKAGFSTSVSGHLGLTSTLLTGGVTDLFGTSQNTGSGITYTDSSVAIDQFSSILSTEGVGGQNLVLNNNFTWSHETLGGSTVYRNPFITLGFQPDPNGLNGNANAVQGTNALTDLVAIVHQSAPMFSITANLDDIIGQLMEWAPPTAAAGALVSKLDFEYTKKKTAASSASTWARTTTRACSVLMPLWEYRPHSGSPSMP